MTKTCEGCSVQFEAPDYKQGQIKRYHNRSCAQKSARARLERDRPGCENRRAIVNLRRRTGSPVDGHLANLAIGDIAIDESPSMKFSVAMISGAIKDLSGIDSGAYVDKPELRSDAISWLTGAADADLPTPCTAEACFEVVGINQLAALSSLGI